MRKNNFLKITTILFYIFVFLFLIKNSYSCLDPDLGWHLKVGEDILLEKNAPSINYYNYTLNKEKWVDHEWLANAFMFYLYKNYGYLSLVLFFALIMLTVLILLNLLIQKMFFKTASPLIKNTEIFFIMLFQILGLLAMSPHIGVRIQEISVLNILLLLMVLYYYEKNKNTKILFFLPALFYFWACVHGGFLIGFFVLFLWIFIKLITKSDIKNLSLFSFLSIIPTFLTPYGMNLYSLLSGYKNAYYLTHIQEWLPFYYPPIFLWQVLYCSIIGIALFLTLFFLREKQKIDIWNITVSFIFLLLTFKSKRHFPLLFVVSFPLLITFFTDQFKIPEEIINKLKTKKSLITLIKFYIIIGLLLIIFYTAITVNFFHNPFNSFCNNYPCQAVDFIKSDKSYRDLKILNPYDWGGYMIWTWPEKKIFIDGRFPQHEFVGHTMLEEYHEFFNKEKMEKKLNEYNINLVLFKKNRYYKLNWFEKYFLQINEEEINSAKNHLKEYLENSKNWKKIFDDKISSVYIRTIYETTINNHTDIK